MASVTVGQDVIQDVSDEQVESFRRDGFLILEEGFLSQPSMEILRERFAASSRRTTPLG